MTNAITREDLIEAVDLAERIMGICGGDVWERECTEEDRSRFRAIYDRLHPAPVAELGRKAVAQVTRCPECGQEFRDQQAVKNHLQNGAHGMGYRAVGRAMKRARAALATSATPATA